MAVVLVLAGIFVYLRVASDLSTSIDDGLEVRVDDLARRIQTDGPSEIGLGGARSEEEDILSEVLRLDGTVVDSSSALGTTSVLNSAELAQAARQRTFFDLGEVPGIEYGTRALGQPVATGDGTYVAVAGASTGDRTETLSGLVATFAVGGPLALLLASATGYGLASLAMRPVEAMRTRASRISLDQRGERLPLPVSMDEIGRLGRTLNEMLDRIEESLDRERAFVADAGHELRTPLAVIRGELELGMRRDRDADERMAAMRSAAEEVDRLQHLADDLLALARSDDGRLPLQRQEVQVPDLLERVRRRFEAQAVAAGRSITIDVDGPIEANLDPLRIEGAMSNLVDNSLRHGAGDIALTGRCDSGALRLSVSDHGTGFPAAFLPVAFERFSRAEAGRTRTGSGLGLAIVRAIAEAHGGLVEIEDRAGPGARVAIELPSTAGAGPTPTART